MVELHLSAIEAMAALRDRIKTELLQTQEYRSWKALETALAELQPQKAERYKKLTASALPSFHPVEPRRPIEILTRP